MSRTSTSTETTTNRTADNKTENSDQGSNMKNSSRDRNISVSRHRLHDSSRKENRKPSLTREEVIRPNLRDYLPALDLRKYVLHDRNQEPTE